MTRPVALILLLAAAPVSLIGQTSAQREYVLPPHHFTGLHPVKPVKRPLVHEQAGEEPKLPHDPNGRLDRKPGPPTPLRRPGEGRVEEPSKGSMWEQVVFAAAPEDPQVFMRTDLGQPPATGFPMEPQVAAAGDVVFLSGNISGAFSLDGGATFTFVQPDVLFGTVDGGFCCDTEVRYSPHYNLFLWLTQYWCSPNLTCPGTSGNSNRYRLAVATPQAIRANVSNPAAAWTVYELTTGLFADLMKQGFGGKTSWFDKPDMAVGNDNVYLTWDAAGLGTINMRIKLADLAAGGNARSLAFTGKDIYWRTAQNLGNTGIWLKNGSNDSEAVVLTLADSSNVVQEHRVSHMAIPTDDYSSLTSLGEDWTGRVAYSRVASATVRGDELWVAWAVGRNYKINGTTIPVLPQPHIQVAVYNVNTFALVRELDYWNETMAYLNPALATNSEGDVGISFSYGGPHDPPGPAVGFLTGAMDSSTAAGADPVSGQGQGDYACIHPDSPDATRFVACGYISKNGPGGVTNRWLFLRFGRGAPAHQLPVATSLTLSCPSSPLFSFPAPVAVSGVLLPHFADAQIQIHVVGPPNIGTSDLATNTNPDGSYRISFAGNVGLYTVQAHFPGDATHGASDSAVCNLRVAPPPG